MRSENAAERAVLQRRADENRAGVDQLAQHGVVVLRLHVCVLGRETVREVDQCIHRIIDDDRTALLQRIGNRVASSEDRGLPFQFLFDFLGDTS